jgi:hypothetical protein
MRLRDVSLAFAVASFVSAPVFALDFSEALQELETGEPVEHVELDNGASMHVSVRNHGGGPDLAIIFDSEEPSGGDDDLGTPNEDFGGPGLGSGGESGERGENEDALGNVLVIAEDDVDEDGDGLVDEPDDESGGGVVWLTFSHAGRLSFTLVDVDEDEEEPRVDLYLTGEWVGEEEGKSLGDNSAQEIETHCTVDAVAIRLDGSSSIGKIELDVPVVGVQAETWSGVKRTYR